MTDAKKIARISERAATVRTIARGIFDQSERRVVLKFVSDAAKLAGHLAPTLNEGMLTKALVADRAAEGSRS